MSLETQDRVHTGMERKEGCEMKRLVLDGIDRVLVKGVGLPTILRGKVEGELQAMVLGPDCPLELLIAETTKGARSFLNRLSNGVAGKVLRVAGVACAGFAMACDTQQDTANNSNQPQMAEDSDNADPQFGKAELAMTEGDLLNLGDPVKIPWYKSGDQYPNIGQLKGEQVITFDRGIEYADGQADETMWYVKDVDILECLKGTPQPIKGLQEAFQEYTNYEYPDVITSYGEGVIYEDKDGKGKLRVIAGLLGPVMLDIDYAEDGSLIASNLSIPDSFYPGSVLTIDGVPYLLSDSGGYEDDILLNLYTGDQQSIDLGKAGMCSMPHVDANGGWWVGSLWMDPKDQCRLTISSTIGGLKEPTSSTSLDYLNNWNGAINPYLTSPRISGNVLMWEEGPFWYAIVQPYCGDGTPNGEETPQSCPEDFGISPDPDIVQPEPQPDATDDAAIAEETGGQIDAVTGPDAEPPIDTSQLIDTVILTEIPIQPEQAQDTEGSDQNTAEHGQDTVEPGSDTAGSDNPLSTDVPKPEDADSDIPEGTADTTPHLKPDADAGAGKPDTVLPEEDTKGDAPNLPKDTVPHGKDAQGSKPETEEEEESSGGGSGGCSVTW